MWTFYDSESVSDAIEIGKKYGGQSNVDDLDIYNPETDTRISDKELEKRCAVYMAMDGEQEMKCDLLPERIGFTKWVKARHILVKLQNPKSGHNVDTQYMWVKVLAL